MPVSTEDFQRVFAAGVRQFQLGGSSSAESLRQAFVAMKAELKRREASDEELSAFQQKIAADISDYPWRGDDTAQRDTAQNMLASAFDDFVRPPTATQITTLFVSRVTFR